ncbi:Acetyltransferase, GNAT [Bacillus cereus 95/8201]|uniref:GNAT acetyltransferase family protein n=2 Tax=Bacillus cereus group TaxID=86661 RepID=A0A0B5NII2_BACTU|nr:MULTISPECIES: GNAT family N-acetyltransferase [Bacillus cereus group]AJG77594.1 GNAT acetyltransferase family protein [Bacillus thuringiensis]AJH65314.1 GNAT acetyltransferase family protein [Bacillus cereus]AJK36430.1 GNAT acetyltransferase family protein [Bacillus cereus]EEL16390.1 Acetyltransferase, GNAT [Bacillus cereus 95/8201]EEM76871.1 Acetyltransferase, GNAT [Bacillus thuringiensis serovar pondicheriensis BGSC 4BA1]
MISELSKNDFYKCSSLINERGQLEVKAVIAGVNPGRIFVDNISSPNSGLIWLGNNDGFFFIGNAENEEFNKEMKHLINNVIKPEAKKVGQNCFEGIGNHSKWNKTIERIFQHRNLKSWNQRVYTLRKEDYENHHESKIEQGYTVLKMDKALYENNNTFKNIDFLQSKILEFWSSPDHFFNEGIGYCIVYDDLIVSVCFSGFVFENIHCIDIETIEEHQGKKLAQKITHSFVKDCLENNITPYWDCMELNKPSVAVVENVGFINVCNYVGYYFLFDE